MIKLFLPDDRDFSSNGELAVLPIRGKVRCEDEGDYYLDLEADSKYGDCLTAHNLLVVTLPAGQQPFRITNVEQTHDRIIVKAKHVYFDLSHYLVPHAKYTNSDCANALSGIYGEANTCVGDERSVPLTLTSDISTLETVEFTRRSLADAVLDCVKIWDGHLIRDGFVVSIVEHWTSDRDKVIRYGRDLKEIRVSTVWDDVVTKLLPIGKDDTDLSGTDISYNDGYEVENGYVISAHYADYAQPYIKSISFSQNIDKKNYNTEAAYKAALQRDLREQALRYVKEHDKPQVNYTITAYVDEPVEIGETIRVIDESLGIELETHVTAFTYDCLLDAYSEVQFGNTKRKLSDLKK